MKTTYLLILLNVLVYGAMMAATHGQEASSFSTHTLLEFGAIFAPLVHDGQWWRLITATFIHITPMHIIMNMVALWQVGLAIEPFFGRARYVALYLVTGIGGWALSLAWHWHAPTVAAGASGAISGLIGAGVIAGHLIGGAGGRRFRDQMLMWAGIVLVYGLMVSGIDNSAHAGGFLVGLGGAWLMIKGPLRARARRPETSGVGTSTLLLVLLVGVSFLFAGRRHLADAAYEQLDDQAVELVRSGKYAEGVAEFRRALAAKPNDAFTHYQLGVALTSDGKLKEGLAEERAALALDPSLKAAQKAEATLLEALKQPR